MITIAIVRNILVRVGADLRGYQSSMQRAGTDVNRFSTRARASLGVAKTAFVAFAVAGVAALGAVSTMAIRSAMEFESSMQQVNRIMGANSAEFIKWGNTQASSFNMSRLEAVKYGSVYGNLISGISSSQKETMDLTTQLLKSSAVVASATGREMTDVMERIRSGLLGNTESIEDLGINVNVAMLESTKAFQKFANGKSWNQLSFQTQQQIRLFAILEQSAVKYGTEVNKNTSSGVAKLTSMLKDAQLNLGQAFLPVVNIVLPILTSFAQRLKDVTNQFSLFMQALFGINKEQSQSAKSAADAASAQLTLGNATKKAGDKAKKGVAGFDEINQLQEEMAANAEDAADTMSGTGTTPTPDKPKDGGSSMIPQGLIDAAERARKAFEPLSKPFDDFRESLRSLGISIRENPHIQAWLERFKTDMKNVGTGGILALSGSLTVLSGAANIASGILSGDFETSLRGMEQVASGAFDIVTGIMYPFFPNIAKKMQDFKKDFGEKWASLKGDVKLYGDPAKLEASDFGNYIRDNVSAKWGELKVNTATKWGEIKATLSEKWSSIVAMPWADVKNRIAETWQGLKTDTETIWEGIKQTVKNNINSMLEHINSLIRRINGLGFEIPPLVIAGKTIFGGASVSFPDMPEIPMLATGGEIAKPTLAVMGERRKKEVVLPLEDSSVWDMMASTVGTAVLNAMQFAQPQQGNRAQGQTAVFNLDGTQLARAIIPFIDKEEARQGTMAIQGV